jgi:hypothetical protein
MERIRHYKVKFSVNYPSGAKWVNEKEVIALSEYGAKEFIKWLKAPRNITFISIELVGYGGYVQRDPKTLGHF